MSVTPNFDLHTLHVTMAPELKRQVWEAAKAEDRTMTAWVKRAILEKLERNNAQMD